MNKFSNNPKLHTTEGRQKAFLSNGIFISPLLKEFMNAQIVIPPEIKGVISQLRETQEIFKKSLPNFGVNSPLMEALAGIDGFGKKLSEIMKAMQPVATGFNNVVAEAIHLSVPWAKGLAKFAKQSAAVKATGWLPHYTFPFEMIGDFEDESDSLREAIDRHYHNNWASIKDQIIKNVNGYLIEEESKTAFIEALGLHEAGFYRSVTCMLFPEIERATRAALYNNKMNGISSVTKLQEFAGSLTSDDITFQGYYGFEFFGRLVEHAYVSVHTGNVEQFRNDTVPNRHAALHGHVIYDSEISSLNMIFMTDYILQVIAAYRKVSRSYETDESFMGAA